VSNRVSRRQADRWQQQGYGAQQGYGEGGYPPEPEPAGPDPIAQLRDLAALKEQGVLTDEEFAVQKSKLLGM
jgi:hypothetical protein